MAADALEQSVLESKDREQLVAIASALGVKSTSRAKKADLIQKILEQTGALPVAGSTLAATAPAQASLELGNADTAASSGTTDSPTPAAAPAPRSNTRSAGPRPAPASAPAPAGRKSGQRLGADGEPLADWEIELIEQGISTDTQPVRTTAPSTTSNESDGDGDDDTDGDDNDDGGDAEGSDGQEGDGESRNRRRRRRRNKNRGESTLEGEQQPRPDVAQRADAPRDSGTQRDNANSASNGNANNGGQRDNNHQRDNANQRDANQRDNQRDANQRDVNQRDVNQRDNRNRNERFDRDDTTSGLEPVPVAGYLDLRDEGYGFLRVSGYLSSRDDSYIPVKLTRQFGLRKGDHITGVSRPAGRNEKNPALLEVHSVNGADPEKARDRPRFEELTPVFPDSMLRLETPGSDATDNMTARIIDLVSPIGFGSRGLVVAPRKAGKSSITKLVAAAVERNHPTAQLLVLLIDERPEEVTEMRRAIAGEVVASGFDRPGDEHIHLAEMVIEKAKRHVEQGEDVVVILDGITRLSRAYNAAAPASGRLVAGIDAAALHAAKRFFGAARKTEEGGSLTVIATALVGTDSRMDDAIVDEFSTAANMELRLDRVLAAQRIFPAIDIAASGTMHEELLFTESELQRVRSMRTSLTAPTSEQDAPAVERLVAQLGGFAGNTEFLASDPA